MSDREQKFVKIAQRAQRLANERGGDYDTLSHDELCRFMLEYDGALTSIESGTQARNAVIEECAQLCEARMQAERIMRDDARHQSNLDLSRAHSDRAHVLQEQAAAIRALASSEKVTVPVILPSVKLVLEQMAVLVEKGALPLSETPKWLRLLAEGPKPL